MLRMHCHGLSKSWAWITLRQNAKLCQEATWRQNPKDHGLQCCPCNSHPTIGFHNHACIVKDTKDAKRWWKHGKRVAPNMTISMNNKFYFQYIIGHAYWLHPAFCWSYSTHADFRGPSNQWPRHVALFFTHARCEILGNGGCTGGTGLETVAMDPRRWSWIVYPWWLEDPPWLRKPPYGFVWKCCVPLNPMVLLIIIPMKNGYFIGNIPYFQTNPYWYDIPQFETYPQWQASRKAVLGRRLAPAKTFSQELEAFLTCRVDR